MAADAQILLNAWCEQRDPAARRRLIEEHLPLVRSLARRFVSRGEQLEDLVQVGAVGLIKAVDRYDRDRGDSLAAYAIPTIAGEIRRHLRDASSTVRPPRALVDAAGAAPRSVPLEDGAMGAHDTAAERSFELREERILVEAGLRRLPQRERRILQLRYYGGLSQRRIGAELGLSQVHVSRLLRSSLVHLRREIGRTDP